MISSISHVAIVVPDVMAAKRTFETLLGVTMTEHRVYPRHGVIVSILRLPGGDIELMEPIGDDTPLSRFLERQGGGALHHICLKVSEIDLYRDRMLANGCHPIGDGSYEIGVNGNPILFFHPRDFHGVLIELEQEASPKVDAINDPK